MIMDWLKKAPTPLVITIFTVIGVTTLAYLGGFVFLLAQGIDTTDYRGLLNTAFNYIGILLGATTTVASVTAARSASRAEEQTNGHLAEKDTRIAALEHQVTLLREES
jgi:predicted MFS family arabinose efflux permease